MCINLYCMPAVHYMVFQSKEWKAGFIIHCASFSGQGTVEKHTFEKKKGEYKDYRQNVLY